MWQRPGEGLGEYMKNVWTLVKSSTDNEDTQRLWITNVTSHPVNQKEPVQSHYKWLFCEDINDEDVYLARACEGLNNCKVLSQIWHEMNKVVVLMQIPWGL